MELESGPGFDGTQAARTQGHNLGSSSSSSLMQLPGYVLRIIAIVLTLISAIVMGVAKEPAMVIELADSGTVNTFTSSVKSGYSSAFVYFIVVNVIVFIYSIISLVMAILNRGGWRRIAMLLSFADLVMVVLLFSSNGAAAAISVVSDKGIPRYAWPKFCGPLHSFCRNIKASIVLSMFASLAYVLLVGLSIIELHK